MGFDDIFEQKGNHHKHGYGQHKGHDDDHYNSSHFHNKHGDFKQQLFSAARNNPRLKVLLIIAVLVLIAVVVLVVILLFPLLLSFLDFLGQNGIQGLIESVWKGTK